MKNLFLVKLACLHVPECYQMKSAFSCYVAVSVLVS